MFILDFIASTFSLVFASRVALLFPCLIVFLSLFFSNYKVDLGFLNKQLYVLYFLPVFLIWFAIKKVKYVKENFFKFRQERTFLLLIFIITLLPVLTHLFAWNTLPKVFLREWIFSFWALPLLFLSDEEMSYEKLIKFGSIVLALSAFLYLPQALYFYIGTLGKSLGREVSGGLEISWFKEYIPMILPLEVRAGRVYTSLFSMGEVASQTFTLLIPFLFGFLSLKNVKVRFKVMFYILVFTVIYINQYLTQILIFLILNACYIFFGFLQEKRNVRALALVAGLFVISTSLTFSSRFTHARISENKIAEKAPSLEVIKRKGQGRLFAIKSAVTKYVKAKDPLGLGDYLSYHSEMAKKKELEVSSHSFIVDLIVRFGIFAIAPFVLFIYVLPLICSLDRFFIHKDDYAPLFFYFFITFLATSIITIQGRQPVQMGFMLFIHLAMFKLLKIKDGGHENV